MAVDSERNIKEANCIEVYEKVIVQLIERIPGSLVLMSDDDVV